MVSDRELKIGPTHHHGGPGTVMPRDRPRGSGPGADPMGQPDMCSRFRTAAPFEYERLRPTALFSPVPSRCVRTS